MAKTGSHFNEFVNKATLTALIINDFSFLDKSDMKHILDVKKEHSLFIVTTEGEGHEMGILAFLKDVVGHPDWRPGMSILVDHRELSIHNIQHPGISMVSDFFIQISDKLGNGKLALVMNKDIDYGIARAWQNITEDLVKMEICVFREIDKARSWIMEGF